MGIRTAQHTEEPVEVVRSWRWAIYFSIGLGVVLGLSAVVMFIGSPTIASWAFICAVGIITVLAIALGSTSSHRRIGD